MLDVKMTRSQFMALTGVVAVSALSGLWQWGTSIDEDVSLKKISDFPISPGWLESRTKAPFIDSNVANRGHFEWMRETIFVNPLLTDLTKDYFKYLNENLEKRQRLSLGDMISYTYENALKKMRQKYKGLQIDPETTLPLEAMHAGLFAFAAVTTPWFSEKDMNVFGVDLGGRSVVDYYWDDNGLARHVFPMVFVDNKNRIGEAVSKRNGVPERANGQDRVGHFASHLLLTFNYLYSNHFNLSTHKRIPKAISWIVNWRGGDSIYNKARALSWLAGHAYELKALSDLDSWPLPFIKNRKDVTDGLFDPRVNADLDGNTLGAETGIALYKTLVYGKSFDHILKELNSRFLELGEEPQLFVPHGDFHLMPTM